MSKKDSRSRNYILTNNYKNDEPINDELLLEMILSMNGVVYTAFQLEEGELKTQHHQIYISFKNAERFSKLKSAFPKAHIEVAKGTPQQVSDYCTKDESRIREAVIHGTLPKQGKRNDLEDIMNMLEDGCTPYDIKKEYPSQYLRYKDRIEKIHEENRAEEYKTKYRNVVVYYIGDASRVGKTRFVMERYGYDNVYRVTNYRNPFDGYKGQRVLVFEEFRESLAISDMLVYLEGYPLQLPARYYDRQACYTIVFIISNWCWSKQYNNEFHQNRETYNAFKKRFKDIGTLSQIKQTVEMVELLGKDAITIKGGELDEI